MTVSTWNRCRGLGRTIGGVLLETLCGAAVLGMLAGLLATTMPKKYMDEYIVVGVLLGSLLGFLIGLANYWPTRQSLCGDAPREG